MLQAVIQMSGFITDRHLEDAESAFPGIRRLYEAMIRKPTTFLELVWTYEALRDSPASLPNSF